MTVDILFVSKSLEIGGAETNICDLSVAMKGRGLVIGVLILSRASVTQLSRLEQAGITVEVLNVSGFSGMLIGAIKTIQNLDPKVVHSHMPLANQICRMLRPFYRAALVTTEHNDWMRLHPWHRKVSLLSSRLDTVSLACSQSVADSFPYLLKVNENGRDFSGIPLNAGAVSLPNGVCPERDAIFLNVANVNKKKDQYLLVEAFTALPQKISGRKPVLLIAGEQGDAWDSVLQAIEERELQDRAFLLGARNDVPALMQIADCMVLTSKFEGLPLTVLEAMYLRLPVVSVDVGEIRRVLDQSPWLVRDREPHTIAKAMIAAVENVDESWLEDAYELTISKYSIARQVDDVLEVYQLALVKREGRYGKFLM